MKIHGLLQKPVLMATSSLRIGSDFSQAVVPIHLRLTERMRASIIAVDFAAMRSDALGTALCTGRLGMAAIYVYKSELIDEKEYCLLQLNNIICTPHLGYVDAQGYGIIFDVAFLSILKFCKEAQSFNQSRLFEFATFE